ncbi:g3378 [Coccomyxa elongata]
MAMNAAMGPANDSAVDVEQPLMDNAGNMGYDLVDCGNGYSSALLYQKPAETLKWIELGGVQKLGTFKVRDSTVLQLLENNGILTLGMDSRDIDWQCTWRTQLEKDNRPGGEGKSAVLEVEAYVVDIEGAACADDAGLLNPLLHCFQRNIFNANVWALPAVEAVITFKWQQWAQRWMHMELAIYLLWLLAFQIFIFLFQDEDTSLSLTQLLHTRSGVAAVVFEMVAVLGMLPFVYIEVCSVIEYGPFQWINSFWNFLDIVSYVAQISITVMHLGRLHLASNEVSVLMAMQVLILWVKVQYFARVLQPSKNPFIDTLRAVINDVKWFLFLLLLTMWGFCMSFYILFRRDQKKEQFRTIGSSLVTVFNWLMGGVDLTIFNGTHNPEIGLAMLLVYWFTMSMVLLNCLIAILADACSRVNENQDARFLSGRAEIIDELESSIPGWLRERNAAMWYPRYVHFLRVNRHSADPSMTEAAEKEDAMAQQLDNLEAQVNRIAGIQELLAQKLLDQASYESLPKEVKNGE